MKINKKNTLEIKQVYSRFKEEIGYRLNEFSKKGKNATPEELFAELAFCILTPQSKAKLCWEAILSMQKKGVLLKGTKKAINKELQKVRFKNIHFSSQRRNPLIEEIKRNHSGNSCCQSGGCGD